MAKLRRPRLFLLLHLFIWWVAARAVGLRGGTIAMTAFHVLLAWMAFRRRAYVLPDAIDA